MMNKQIFKAVGVTESEYRQWCKDNKRKIHDPKSKEEFFSKIQEGRLVRDSESKKLVKKYKRRK